MYFRTRCVLSTVVSSLNDQITAALRGFMSDHGISQAQVARHLGRSDAYVSGRMTGKLDLSIDIVGAVAELARLSARALMVDLTERMGR